MKKTKIIIAAVAVPVVLAVLALSFFLIGRGGDSKETKPGANTPKEPSEGLEYVNLKELYDEMYEGTGYEYEVEDAYMVGGIGSCTDTDIVIPSTYKGKPVRRIDSLYGDLEITSITIPDSVTEISLSLSSLGNLTSINVAENNANYFSIDGVLFAKFDEDDGSQILYAYPANKPDSSYSIPNGTTMILSDAFYNCPNLTHITVPSSVKWINGSAFWFCTELTSVTFFGGTRIDSCTFNSCPALTTITFFSNSVTSIDKNAFFFCSSLTSINIIGSNANYSSVDGVLFNKDQSVIVCYPVGKSGSYSIPDSVRKIGDSAFFACSGLESITIPGSITSIGEEAFYLCNRLTSITYNGTKEQWKAISKGSGWKENTAYFTVVYCTDGEISKADA